MGYQHSAISGSLNEQQQKSYWDNGYLFPMSVLTPEEVAGFRSELEQIERDWLDNGLSLPLQTYKRVNAQVVMPLAHKIGTHPAILDVVEGVMGPDILLYSVEFMIKEPNTKQVVTMHQDLTYWGMGEIDGILTAWVALSDATRDSGCMDFVKASHKNPILPHEDSFDEDNLLSRGQEITVDVAQEDKVAGELSAGQMSLHHGLTIHGSGPNQSTDRRIGAVIRYLSPHVVKPMGDKDYAMKARGTADTGNFNICPPPAAMFEKNALELYEEIREVQTKVMMAGAKKNQGMYKASKGQGS